MITEQETIQLLKKYNFRDDGIQHVTGVSNFAYDLAKKIKEKNPSLDINPEKVKIAGLLHDIGKSVGIINHEIHSIDILKKEGLEYIANIVFHGISYEKQKLRGIDDPDLLPKTIENKIIAYSDLRFKNKPMTLEERILELKNRENLDESYRKALDMCYPRLLKLEEELLSLAL